MITRRGEEGFTLVEALIGIMILGIIMSALSVAVLLYFRTTDQTTQKLSESPGLQLASAYFSSDAQASDTTLSALHCLSAGQSSLVSFRWQDPGTAANFITDNRNFVVSYVVVTAGLQKELWRNQCVGDINTDGTKTNQVGPLSSLHLVKFIDPTTSPTTSAPSGGTQIEMKLCTSTGTACKDDQFTFSLIGTRRKP